jgi:hypothetical protein
MRVSVVRPDAFQEVHLAPLGRFDMQAGKVSVFGKGDTPRRWLSTDNAAALVAAVTADPSAPSLIEFGAPRPSVAARRSRRLSASSVARSSVKQSHAPSHDWACAC